MIPTESSWNCALALGFALLLTGCGNTSKTNPPPDVTVTLSSSSLTLQTGTTHQFSAIVEGTSNTAVSWSVNKTTGGNTSVGTINSDGLYTAPSQTGTYTVTATSQADTTKSASAQVNVQPPSPAVSISPTTSTLGVSATQQFTATVQNVTNPSLSWSVDGVAGGNSTVGTISDQGLYTAPSVYGTHTVGVNVSSSSAAASSSVTVFSISVTPSGVVLAPGATQQYTAAVEGLSSPTLTWFVDGTAGGSGSLGTISATGLYTAPSGAGTHTISVSANVDPAVAATT